MSSDIMADGVGITNDENFSVFSMIECASSYQ